MNQTVHEVAAAAGVSVRTLHYYDQIGLLRPSNTTEAGYRLYDDAALARLQQILFFRELDFPLSEIREILDNPSFDKQRAMHAHKELLILKRERLERLIALVNNTLKGEKTMSLKEFDMTEIEQAQKQYADEARQRWGSTDAYKQSAKRTASYSKEDWARVNAEAEQIYDGFAAQMGNDPACPPPCSSWSPTGRRTSAQTSMTAQRRCSPVLARCTSPTSGLPKTSTSAPPGLRSL